MKNLKLLSAFIFLNLFSLYAFSQITADGKIIIRELCEICDDGIDNDDDGHIDCEDLDCVPTTSGIVKTTPPKSAANCPVLSDEEKACLGSNLDLIEKYDFSVSEALVFCEFEKYRSDGVHIPDFECASGMKNDYFDANGNYIGSFPTQNPSEGQIRIINPDVDISELDPSEYFDNSVLMNEVSQTYESIGNIANHFIQELCWSDECREITARGVSDDLVGQVFQTGSLNQGIPGLPTYYNGGVKACTENLGILIALRDVDSKIDESWFQNIDIFRSVLIHEINHILGEYDSPSGFSCHVHTRRELNVFGYQHINHILVYYNEMKHPSFNCVTGDIENGQRFKESSYGNMIFYYNLVKNLKYKKWLYDTILSKCIPKEILDDKVRPPQ